MSITISLFFSILVFSFSTKSEPNSFKDRHYSVVYEKTDGRFNGKYTSYYGNGNIKAEGFFTNNYRSGIWTVWDTTGSVCIQRNYSDPFNYESIVPPVPQDPPIQLINVSQYKIDYNPQGFIDYFEVTERMVLWASRIWRYLSITNNLSLFENDRLFKSIYNLVLTGKVHAYDPSSDDFLTVLKEDIDTNSISVIGYKIKEDIFFDTERFVTESRIIGICPVAVNNADTIDLFWVYFPSLREFFAKELINATDSRVNSIDDLFFFRYFSSTIYKQSNLFDQEIADYTPFEELEKEAERIEISLIESEHDLWLYLTKCPVSFPND